MNKGNYRMKIKDGYILETIGEQKIAIALEVTPDKFSGMIKLNHVGAFLWELLMEDVEKDFLVKELTKKYDISDEIAGNDVKAFLDILEKNGILEK